MIGVFWRHPVVRMLARDRFVQAYLAVFAAELVFYVAPVATPAFRQEFGRAMFLVPFLVIVAPAAMVGLSRITDREERRFWRAIAASCTAWLAAVVVYASDTGTSVSAPLDLLIDGLFFLSYIPLLLAIEWRPHHGVPLEPWEPDRWTHVLSMSCVTVGWFSYFVVVPAWFDTAFYGSLIPTYLFYVALDLVLVSLYFLVGWRCRVPRWRILYWAVGAGSLAMAVVDTMDLLQDANLLHWVSGRPPDLLWALPGFVYLLAIRMRHAPLGSGERVGSGQAGSTLEERTRSGAMVLGGALSFPLVHLWLQPALPIGPELRHAQGVVVLVMLGTLGTLAVVTYRLLERRHRALAEASRVTQHQLREGQRLEAIGRLAGGIAHDFNNMLTGIVGYNDLALQGLPGDDPNRPALEQIARAAARASTLTQQLLALSRRQILKPERANLNAIVGEAGPALIRVAGGDVRLVTRLAPDLHEVMADPTQVHTALLTLAANARDAMPGGGTIDVSTANVTLAYPSTSFEAGRAPGDYVEITVRDSGPDIPLARQVHLFDPFYAAGGKGRGSGLSLAAVHGIVTQSGGTIDVRSEPGAGAAFVIRLPRA